MSATLRDAGKAGFLVDPDSALIRTRHEFEAVTYTNVEDAVAAARAWIRQAGG